jgi:uncharacterized protein (DUF1697 family)
MTTYIALLRGINVGGKNKLPMKELIEMFGVAGCRNAVHYIQSGNVVFQAEPRVAKQLAALIPAAVEKRFGHKPPVVLRTAEQLKTAISENPFLAQGASPDRLHVMFLDGVPDAAAVKMLDPDRSPPDRFIVIGQEVYLQLPNGGGNSKLTNAYFDSKLKTISTVRNWRTVLKLAEMAGEYGS